MKLIILPVTFYQCLLVSMTISPIVVILEYRYGPWLSIVGLELPYHPPVGACVGHFLECATARCTKTRIWERRAGVLVEFLHANVMLLGWILHSHDTFHTTKNWCDTKNKDQQYFHWVCTTLLTDPDDHSPRIVQRDPIGSPYIISQHGHVS